MKVELGKLTCGVSLSALKKLLAADERFDTLTAMKHWDLEEPEITTTLCELKHEGWIDYVGCEGGIDWWKCAANGRRLVATPLLKRIQHAQALALLARLIDEVRAVNEDPESSRRVTRIRLFGSVLTGDPSGTVGDVDVVIDTQRRPLPEKLRRALEAKECESGSASLRGRDPTYRLLWPDIQLRRRLARISTHLSLHGEQDLAESEYREVYAFSLELDREVPVDETRHVGPGSRDTDESASSTAYVRVPRKWPTVQRSVSIDDLDLAEVRRAQHLWMNGQTLVKIAEDLRSAVPCVRAALAARALPVPHSTGKVHASLRDTVLEALPAGRNYTSKVRVDHRSGGWTVSTELEDSGARSARLWRVGVASGRIMHSPPELLSVLQAVDRAVVAWLNGMRPNLRGIEFEAEVSAGPGDSPLVMAGRSKRLEVKTLRAPMEALLERLWTKPRKPYENYALRLSVTLESKPCVTFSREYPKKAPVRCKDAQARAVIELAAAIHAQGKEVLAGTRVMVSLGGQALERVEAPEVD